MNSDKMKSVVQIVFIISLLFLSGCSSDEVGETVSVKPVVKTNPMKVYMHYMPWFQSKPVSGYWGSHWKMTNKNPDNVDGDGKREIASHYYPLIGPYDSKDPDVLEFHLLLMKYAGVDGILIDWYGSHNVYDYKVNLTATNAVIEKLDDVGLQFAVVYEDYVAKSVEDQTSRTAMQAAQEDMAYLQQEYFPKKEHIQMDGAPLLMTFGPRQFKSSTQWTEIFNGLSTKPKFLPLWSHSGFVGSNGNGEFAWVDFNESLSELNSFYNKTHLQYLMGSAYPRFHDFYEEGGSGASYGYVDFNEGETLRNTLAKAKDRNAKYLQLVTWNDFGEGTVIEPTVEDQFLCLEIIQEFTGVTYGKAELELIHNYYLKKQLHKGNAEAMEVLLKVFQHLNLLEVDQAEELLNTL
jgi:glycoprotein endo-alpha-1,2-mannosidase